MAISTVETYAKLGNLATQSATTFDRVRRLYNFGERIAELSPIESPFFSYLSKVSKEATDDPVFKFLEQRHQWQRRNFQINNASHEASGAYTSAWSDWNIATVEIDCGYDTYGRETAGSACPFLIVGQTVAFKAKYASDASTYNRDVIANFRISTVHSTTNVSLVCTGVYDIEKTSASVFSPTASSKIRLEDDEYGQVIGSAFAEGTGAPLGWRDELYDREGYVQIFKTAIPLFSGTAMATKYRGYANEYMRVWKEKLKEHKMDIEHASLFGMGVNDTSNNMRYTWGILPYTEAYGKIYNFTYSATNYDAFLDAMEDFFAPESGNSGDKLVLASRKIITYLNKIGNGGFLNNTVNADQYRLDVQNIQGSFGHNVTTVNTVFGNLHFIQEPLFRNMYENYAVAVDMKHVKWRPLKANGYSRDTFIKTNVQDNDIDGRKDMITTEAGLQIDLPETHAILRFA